MAIELTLFSVRACCCSWQQVTCTTRCLTKALASSRRRVAFPRLLSPSRLAANELCVRAGGRAGGRREAILPPRTNLAFSLPWAVRLWPACRLSCFALRHGQNGGQQDEGAHVFADLKASAHWHGHRAQRAITSSIGWNWFWEVDWGVYGQVQALAPEQNKANERRCYEQCVCTTWLQPSLVPINCLAPSELPA